MSVGRRRRMPTVRSGNSGARRETRKLGVRRGVRRWLGDCRLKRLYRLNKASASNVIHISRCLAKAGLLEESIFIALHSCLCVLQVDSSIGWRAADRSDREFWSDAADTNAAEGASADRRRER